MKISDPEAPAAVAELLGGELSPAPFHVPAMPPGLHGEPGQQEAAPVYQITLRSREHDAPILLLLWPSLARVDVRMGQSTWTLKDISEAELYPGVEVLFRRRSPPALLFVSVNGRVALVA